MTLQPIARCIPTYIPKRVPSLALVQSNVHQGQKHKGVARGAQAILQGASLNDPKAVHPTVPLNMILELTNGVNMVEHPAQTVQETFQICSNAAHHHDRVLTLGGDHSIAVGTIGAQLLEHGDNLGVLWIDAHADINTRKTSPSGNLHGMAVAHLLGLERGAVAGYPWMRSGFPTLSPSQLVYVGLNSLDSAERPMVDALGIPDLTASEVKDMGVRNAMDLVESLVDHFDHLHVSFDVDVCGEISGTGTPDGILTIEETLEVAHEIGNRFNESISGVDLVETNTHDFDCPTTVPLARNVIIEILKNN